MMTETPQMSNILRNTKTRPDVLVHVADNVRRLRQIAALSQQALAEAAGVSRRMLVNIEKGDVNVSLNTLDRLADTLGVLFYALVAPPESVDSAHIDEIAWAGDASGSVARLLASKAARQEVELWHWTLVPDDVYISDADPAGWTNMIVVTEGCLTVIVDEDERTIGAGGFHVFASDRPHRFANRGSRVVRFIRNVVY